MRTQNNQEDDEIEEGHVVEEWYHISNGKGSSKKTQDLKYGQVQIASRYAVLNDLEENEKTEEERKQEGENLEEVERVKQKDRMGISETSGTLEDIEILEDRVKLDENRKVIENERDGEMEKIE